jgi:hypothetical protein
LNSYQLVKKPTQKMLESNNLLEIRQKKAAKGLTAYKNYSNGFRRLVNVFSLGFIKRLLKSSYSLI